VEGGGGDAELQLLEAQYAVRVELYLKDEELKEQGEQIIHTNGETCSILNICCRACSGSSGCRLQGAFGSLVSGSLAPAGVRQVGSRSRAPSSGRYYNTVSAICH
jgi:hypothetical protein